ncbi:MAG: hypothetical protein CFH19_00627 [Alphaproteobacteria bacterium MarineAlpha5_Bin9]|nr:MAG: hypothetical protein CFH19_00627 [Alphaproteobacteria bacterium MarineAlpha5_Bin9]|tara:strand:- start:15537 stop:15953 length:417 start_codon:yes stop_codon:yes gene_type:complete
MIVFNLICNNCNFEFDGWFSDSKEFIKQKKKKIIICPSCNSFEINKAIMAPNVSSKSNSKNKKSKQTIINKIDKYKKIIEKNFDYVGENFTEEAKKIKYGETPERPIYGEANIEETKELIDEEIPFTHLPWKPDKKTN